MLGYYGSLGKLLTGPHANKVLFGLLPLPVVTRSLCGFPGWHELLGSGYCASHGGTVQTLQTGASGSELV